METNNNLRFAYIGDCNSCPPNIKALCNNIYTNEKKDVKTNPLFDDTVWKAFVKIPPKPVSGYAELKNYPCTSKALPFQDKKAVLAMDRPVPRELVILLLVGAGKQNIENALIMRVQSPSSKELPKEALLIQPLRLSKTGAF